MIPSAAEGDLCVEVVDSWGSLSAEAMRFVDARTQNPFMRTAWLGCWYRSYLPPGSSTYVVILRNGRGIVAVAPMTVRRIGPVRLFRFAGHGVSNYLDIVAPDEELPFALATLLQHAEVNLTSDAPIELEPSATLRPKGGIAMRVRLRRSPSESASP